MQALIDRLEKAKYSSHELDAAIGEQVGLKYRSRRTAGGKNKGREWFVDSCGGEETWSHKPPNFTGSLDAAATLIPDGFHWAIRKTPLEDAPPLIEASVDWAEKQIGATPAIALCIAALKARAALAQARK